MSGSRSRGGVFLVAALAVDAIGNGLFLPLSIIYFTELTNVSVGVVGGLLSVANAVTLPMPLWVGTLVDKVGALPVVIAAQLLQGVGFLAYAWVDGPVGIFIAAALVAVGVRCFWSSVFTAVADYADGSRSGWSTDTWYAISNGARTAGLAAGGLCTGFVVAVGGAGTYRGVAYVAVGCFLVAAAAIAAFVRTPRLRHDQPATSRYATLVRDRPFLGLIGLNTIYALTSIMLGLALPTLIQADVAGPAWLTAVLLAGNALLIAVLSAPVVKRLSGVRRTRSVVTAAMLWAAWSGLLAVLALAPPPPGPTIAVLVVSTLMFTIAELIHAPVVNALAAAAAPPQARGRYLATFQYSFTIASVIAPAFFATLFEIGHALPWAALAIVNCASITAVLLLERHLPAAALR